MVFPKRSQKKELLVPRSKETENANTLNVGNKETDEEDDQARGEKHIDVQQATVFPGVTRDQAPFDK